MDVVLGVAVTGPVARLALVESAAGGHGVIDQSVVDLTGDPTELLTETIVGTHQLLAQDSHRLAATRVCWPDDARAEELRRRLTGSGVADVTVVSGADAATALVRSVNSQGVQGDSALLLVDDDTATLTIVGADDVTTSVIAAEPVAESDAVTACNTLLDRLREEPGAAENLVLLSTAGDVTAYADQVRAVSPLPLDVPDQPAFAIARGAALAASGRPAPAAATAQGPVLGGQLAYSMADDSPLPVELADYSQYDVPLQTPMAPLSEIPEGEEEDQAPPARPRMLLVGSAVAGIVVVAFAALAVSVAIGIRPAAVAEPQPRIGSAPDVYYPPLPAEEWKQEEIDPPLPLPPAPKVATADNSGGNWSAGGGGRPIVLGEQFNGNIPIGTPVPIGQNGPWQAGLPGGPVGPVGPQFDGRQVVDPINAFLGARTSCEYILMGRLVNNTIREVTSGGTDLVRAISANGKLEEKDSKGNITIFEPGGKIEHTSATGITQTLEPDGKFVETTEDGIVTTILPGGVASKTLPDGSVEKLKPEEVERILPVVDDDPTNRLNPFDAFTPNPSSESLLPGGSSEAVLPDDSIPGIKIGDENVLTGDPIPGVTGGGPLPDAPVNPRRITDSAPIGDRAPHPLPPEKIAPEIKDITPPAPIDVPAPIQIEKPKPIDIPEPAAPVIDIPEPAAPVIDLPEPAAPVIDIPEPAAPVIDIPEPAAPVIDIPEPAAPVIDIPEPAAPVIPELPKLPNIFGGDSGGSSGSAPEAPSLPELPNLFNPFG